MTSTYVVLLHGDEQWWRTADAESFARMRSAHVQFAQDTLAAGHRIVGGEQLQPSGTAIVVRAGGAGHETTEGPFAETVEQVGGYYVVETDDVAGLAALVAPLADFPGAAVELRPVVDHSGDADLGARAHARALA